jgi:SPP1 family predicted phage head-tail adaptor
MSPIYLNPGELNQKIKIKVRTGQSIIDIDGISREVLEDITSLWASVQIFEKKDYYFELELLKMEVNTMMKIRFNNNLQPLMIVETPNGKRYDICIINDVDNKHIEMHLLCAKLVDLDKVCIVKRKSNLPSQTTPIIVGQYPCTLMRKTADYKQGTPNAVSSESFYLYAESVINIKPGDLIQIDDVKYIASAPYKPKNHHAEVGISIRKDA